MCKLLDTYLSVVLAVLIIINRFVLTFNQSPLHARICGVDVGCVRVVAEVLQQRFRVGQALDDGIHEAGVADVLETVETLLLDGAGTVLPAVVETVIISVRRAASGVIV